MRMAAPVYYYNMYVICLLESGVRSEWNWQKPSELAMANVVAPFSQIRFIYRLEYLCVAFEIASRCHNKHIRHIMPCKSVDKGCFWYAFVWLLLKTLYLHTQRRNCVRHRWDKLSMNSCLYSHLNRRSLIFFPHICASDNRQRQWDGMNYIVLFEDDSDNAWSLLSYPRRVLFIWCDIGKPCIHIFHARRALTTLWRREEKNVVLIWKSVGRRIRRMPGAQEVR